MSTTLLNEKDAAPIVGMSVAWLQRKRWEGGGPPYVKYDRAVRYRLTDLLEWVDRHVRLEPLSQSMPTG